MARNLADIAHDIAEDWGDKVNFAAKPYLHAMSQMHGGIESSYGQDGADTVILYFLSNAGGWRGNVAREVKKELKQMIKDAGH